jgi:hypothetical protein
MKYGYVDGIYPMPHEPREGVAAQPKDRTIRGRTAGRIAYGLWFVARDFHTIAGR